MFVVKRANLVNLVDTLVVVQKSTKKGWNALTKPKSKIKQT